MNNNPATLNLRQRLRFLAKDSILYGCAASINKAFALLTFPILARHFSVDQYGLYDFLNVGISLLVTLMVFGQDSAVARFFYEESEMRPRQEVISQSLVFQVGLMVVFLLPFWMMPGQVGTLMSSGPGISDGLFRLILMQVPFLVLINFSQNILKWTFSRTRFLIVSLGSTLCSISALLAALYWFKVDLVEVFVIFLLVRAVFSLVGLWFCLPWLIWPKEWHFLKPMLLYAAPYGMICTVSSFIPAMERTFIMEFLQERDLGLYAAGAKVAMLVSLPIQAFQVAWGPFSLAIYREPNAYQTYNQVFKGFTFGVALLVMALTLLAEPIIRLLASNQYAGASLVVFPMAMGLGCLGVSSIVNVGISLSKKSYLNLVSYSVYLIMSFIAMYVLISCFGLVGVAWGALLGRFTMSIIESWISWRVYPLPWAFFRVLTCLAVLTLWGAAGQAVELRLGLFPRIFFMTVVIPLLIPFCYFFLFTPAERNQIVHWATNSRRVLYS